MCRVGGDWAGFSIVRFDSQLGATTRVVPTEIESRLECEVSLNVDDRMTLANLWKRSCRDSMMV